MKMERPVLRTFLVSNYSFQEDVKEIFVSLSNSRKTLKLLGMAKLALYRLEEVTVILKFNC